LVEVGGWVPTRSLRRNLEHEHWEGRRGGTGIKQGDETPTARRTSRRGITS